MAYPGSGLLGAIRLLGTSNTAGWAGEAYLTSDSELPFPGGTAGSVLFVDASGNIDQDNAAFFWDVVQNYLGIGTNAPGANLDIQEPFASINLMAADAAEFSIIALQTPSVVTNITAQGPAGAYPGLAIGNNTDGCDIALVNSGANGTIAFYTSTVALTPIDRWVIQADGDFVPQAGGSYDIGATLLPVDNLYAVTLFTSSRIDTNGAAALNLGDANATSVNIADTLVTTTVEGPLVANESVLVAGGNVLDTNAAGALNIGPSTATSVEIADTLVTTTVQGPLTVSELATFSSDMTFAAGKYIEGFEGAAPAAPAANGFRIFSQDNGAGKTQLMVIFQSGAAQVIATEP